MYTIDARNRLLIDGSPVAGKFRVLSGGELGYRVKPSPDDPEGLPEEIRLRGRWVLSPAHDLTFTLERSGRKARGETLAFSGAVIGATGNEIAFSLTTISADGIETSYLLTLEGAWSADKDNKLIFSVSKGERLPDALIFSAGWCVSDDYSILYTYKRRVTSRGPFSTHSFVLKGCWYLAGGNRISFSAGADPGSRMDFTASYASLEKAKIVYELGVTVGSGKREKCTIGFFGTWKIDPKTFLTFKLRNSVSREYLGVTLELTRKLFSDRGEAFIRFLSSREETEVFLGGTFRW